MAYPPGSLQASATRSGLSGFLVSGLLVSFLGTVLPVWGYHINTNSLVVGAYFLAQSVGLFSAALAGPTILRSRGPRITMVTACGLATAALLLLAFCTPPVHFAWRIAGVLITGFAAGLLNTCLLHALTPAYEHDPASTVNLGGAFFGLGCLLTALIVSGTFYTRYGWLILLLLALPSAVAAFLYYRWPLTGGPVLNLPKTRQVLDDFRSPAAVLFTLLLFFQFGNEWSLAGWLPIYLSQRLGLSPATSITVLALYWFSLLVGRYVAQFLLPRFSHRRLLFGSIVAPLFGSSALASTDNLFGAVVAVLFLGGGFAMIYPLVVEKIGHRFPYFHPGLFGGIFSVGMVGALLAPATVGVYAHFWGIGALVGVPLLGTIMVFLLHLLIALEARLSGKPGA